MRYKINTRAQKNAELLADQFDRLHASAEEGCEQEQELAREELEMRKEEVKYLHKVQSETAKLNFGLVLSELKSPKLVKQAKPTVQQTTSDENTPNQLNWTPKLLHKPRRCEQKSSVMTYAHIVSLKA